MSTYPLGQAPLDQDPAPAGQLSWRVWLLLPLVLVGAFGIAVPAFDLEVRPRLTAPPPPETRVPYADDLAPLLEREELGGSALRMLLDEHERLQREQREHGGMTESDAKKVRKLVTRYG